MLAWISYDHDRAVYIIYHFCPFDYCSPPDKSVSINLNLPNGADTQCNLNRAGTLCGQCKPNFSLSFGSTECIECQGSKWYGELIGLIIFEVLGGLLLVVIILLLNMTVAVGTINGLIIYANLIASNISAFIGSIRLSFPSIIITWLNLDIGFNICISEGNDAHIKTWVELVFPVCIILIAVSIWILCKYSQRFATLISKKNPVATLATLYCFSHTQDISVQRLRSYRLLVYKAYHMQFGVLMVMLYILRTSTSVCLL